MPLLIPLCIAVLVATAANVLHWRLRGGRLLLWPTGILGWIFNALSLANLLAAILFLAHVAPDWVLWSTMFSLGLATDAYSIWRRRTCGGNARTSGVA
jgi:hypothetical protein